MLQWHVQDVKKTAVQPGPGLVEQSVQGLAKFDGQAIFARVKKMLAKRGLLGLPDCCRLVKFSNRLQAILLLFNISYLTLNYKSVSSL